MKPIRKRILLVEDNPSDCEIIRRSVARGGLQVDLVVASGGQEAVQILDCSFAGGAPIDLVFLDLNLPDCDGVDILRHVRESNAPQMPVVVLTTSDSQHDVTRCYRQGCNGYMVKPSSLAEYVSLLRASVGYWMETAVPAPRLKSDSTQANGNAA